MTDVIQQAREWVAAWDDPPTARISHPMHDAVALASRVEVQAVLWGAWRATKGYQTY